MKNLIRVMFLGGSVAGALTLMPARAHAQGGEFTVQIGQAPLPPQILVDHSNPWHYFKGLSAPPDDWNTVDDASLDASWLTGAGGIGYGDNDDTTILNDMRNVYLTVYLRQSFEVTEPIDASSRLILDINYDDGFVAYLDGVEVARSANVPGTPGTIHPWNQDLNNDAHEATGAVPFDLGSADALLTPGTHVLAIQGINDDIASSDFTMIADLLVTTSGGIPTPPGGLFTLVNGSSVVFTGTNGIAGSSRVTLNGEDASLNLGDGTWSRTVDLSPGMNHFFVAAHDPDGRILHAAQYDVVSEQANQPLGGLIDADRTISSANGILRLTGNVTVADGVTLTIEEGTVVLIPAGVSLTANTNGTIDVVGTALNPVHFLPQDGITPWADMTADGPDALVRLRHADVAAGQLGLEDGGVLDAEDTSIRELQSPLILTGTYGQQLTLRRCHVYNYAQAHIDYTPTLIEDCLFEGVASDAMDFEGNPAEIIVRRTTWRRGQGGNTDALDLGNNLDVLIENCLIHDFPDKGVSIADNSNRTTVRNSLVYNCGIGISAYASSDCVISQNTVADCTFGVRLYERNAGQGAGHASGNNNILWGNTVSLEVTNGATFAVTYSDIEATSPHPGEGNINEDPLFVDAANHDYQLSLGSPALGSGLAGGDMGASFPVGGIPPVPLHLAAIPLSQTEILLEWIDDADNETEFEIETSPDGSVWTAAGTAPVNAEQFVVGELSAQEVAYFRVKSTNGSGDSPYSNIARAQTQMIPVLETVVGGTLTANTVWTTNMGRILVNSDVIVGSGHTLTIERGSLVEVAGGNAIRTEANAHILVQGTADQKVVLQRQTAGANWREISASGEGSSLSIFHADISGAEVRFLSGSTGLMEDSNIHDFSPGGSTIVNSLDAVSVTLRRCRVAGYHETLFQRTLMLIEYCLFEDPVNPSSDAVDFDGPPIGSIIRQSTFRNGMLNNTDAVDIGPSASRPVGVIIEDCLMYNFSDKGVSIGEVGFDDSLEIIVRNCLIYDVGIGVQVKDTTEASIYDCTIVNSGIGLHGFEKTLNSGGGRLTNTFNNILWHNDAAIATEDDTFIQVTFTDTFGTNWPGEGNINAEPLFRDPSVNDFRLLPESPCLGTGLGGSDMGVTFPIGGLPGQPGSLMAISAGVGEVLLQWQDADAIESGFVVEISMDGATWAVQTTEGSNATESQISGLLAGQTYFFRVQATNFIGGSFYSEVVALGGDPNDLDGDGLPNDWESDNGYNPNDPSDALVDLDGDGMNTLEEYLAGTDPGDPNSKLAFDYIEMSGADTVEMRFTAQADKAYVIQFKDSLSAGSWIDLINVPVDVVTRSFTASDILFPGVKTRFYRIVVP